MIYREKQKIRVRIGVMLFLLFNKMPSELNAIMQQFHSDNE
jgi:hypothetical protein